MKFFYHILMNKIRLLILEDDVNLGQILHEYLERKGFETTLCRDGEEGLASFKKNQYDLCVFDIMMPKKDGFTVLKEIREFDKQTPVIFLTAKSMKEDTIEGLKLGADDYVNKPFSMEELVLRINAIVKRTYASQETIQETTIYFGIFTLEYDKQLLWSNNKSIKLTTKENELLFLLCKHMNQTVDRSSALKKIWHDDSYFNARSMDVFIARLRKYLKKDENVNIITVHGEGFKLLYFK